MIYFVAVTFRDKVHAQALGLTYTVYAYVGCVFDTQAEAIAFAHFNAKYGLCATRVRAEHAVNQNPASYVNGILTADTLRKLETQK